ncbi:unnamed protein product, partial [Notodromas monacha]
NFCVSVIDSQSLLVQVADVTQFSVEPQQVPRLVAQASGFSSNPFHRMTRKMSFRSGSTSSSSNAMTPLKRSHSTIAGPQSCANSASAGAVTAATAPKQLAAAGNTSFTSTSSAKKADSEKEEFLAPLPPSAASLSFIRASPRKKPSNSSSSLRKQFTKFTQFAFARTTSSSSVSNS